MRALVAARWPTGHCTPSAVPGREACIGHREDIATPAYPDMTDRHVKHRKACRLSDR